MVIYINNGFKQYIKVINNANTKGKVIVTTKESLPKIYMYDFNDKDFSKLKIKKELNLGKKNILIYFSELSSNYQKRKQIIKEDSEWIRQIENKDEYLKSKIVIMVFQKAKFVASKNVNGFILNEF